MKQTCLTMTEAGIFWLVINIWKKSLLYQRYDDYGG